MWLRSSLRAIALLFIGVALGQNSPSLNDLNQAWRETFAALASGQTEKATQSFQNFNRKLHLYLPANGLDWQSEYLAGSLDCRFSESKELGTQILSSLLQDSRDLNDSGKSEIRRLVASCITSSASHYDGGPLGLDDIFSASAHFQTPGIHSVTKGGSLETVGLAGLVISPKSPAELLARRVPASEPSQALTAALARLPSPVTGSVVDYFAITYPSEDKAIPAGIGRCLEPYIQPLDAEFGMGPPRYAITIYTATGAADVYRLAARLHGLQLPPGVIAYSVAEDMSLSGVAAPDACGSMAHELVHLLIKPSFPLAPAWLEEGLASEVAVASPQATAFTFSYSWRDGILKRYWSDRPSVGKLLDLSWSDFNPASEADLVRAATVQATAATFIRYLDAQHKLRDVYLAVRDEHLSANLSSNRSYQQILTEKLNRTDISRVDQDFVRWFMEQGPENAAPAVPCKITNPAAQTSCPPSVKKQ